MSGKVAEPNNTVRSVVEVLVDRIFPDPHQPRKRFDPERLDELKKSISSRGLQQLPVINFWKRDGNGHKLYTIKAGERRWRAHREDGKTHIQCVLDLTPYTGEYDPEREIEQAAENFSREPLSHVEIVGLVGRYVTAKVVARDGDERGAVGESLREIAAAFGKSEAWARNYYTLTKLRAELLPLLDDEDDTRRLGFSEALRLAVVPVVQQRGELKEVRTIRQEWGHLAALQHISATARAVRKARGEKVRGPRPSDEKSAVNRLVENLSKQGLNFVGVRKPAEFRSYLSELASKYSILEIDELLRELQPALLVFRSLVDAFEAKRTAHHNALK